MISTSNPTLRVVSRSATLRVALLWSDSESRQTGNDLESRAT